MNLCDIDVIRTVLAEHGFHFSKALGQNFLTDARIPLQIAEQSRAAEVKNVVEIGPGIGCLTDALCERAQRVVAVEIDKRLFPVLAQTMQQHQNFTLVEGDVLKLSLPELCKAHFGNEPVVACANLPYYITSPAITALLQSRCFAAITVMVQKEVALRIAAAPGTADYGAFSLLVQYYAAPELLFEVPAACFVPQPKVDSAVVRLAPYTAPPVEVPDEKLLFSLIRAAFQMRRKTLTNALMPVLGKAYSKAEIAEVLMGLGLDANIRGERLSLADFAALTRAVYPAMCSGL